MSNKLKIKTSSNSKKNGVKKMGFSNALLNIILWACYFSGGVMIVVDTAMSKDWIIKNSHADNVMPGLSVCMALIVSSVVAAFGAIITNPYSWTFVFTGGQQLASIKNEAERKFYIWGVCLLFAFLNLAAFGFYTVDLLSTHYKTNNWFLSLAIVFGSDVCFLLANTLGYIKKASPTTVEYTQTAKMR
jgi:hypothetical protein